MKNLNLIEEIELLKTQESELLIFNGVTGEFCFLYDVKIDNGFIYEYNLKFNEYGCLIIRNGKNEFAGRKQLFFAEVTESNTYNILWKRPLMQVFEHGDIVAYGSEINEMVGFVHKLKDGQLYVSDWSHTIQTTKPLNALKSVRFIGR